MSTLTGIIGAGARTAGDITSRLGDDLARLADGFLPVAKEQGTKLVIVGRDAVSQIPSFVSKHPKASVIGAGALGAGGITGLYLGAEALSPYLPGEQQFAFGYNTPGGNVWMPFDPKTQTYVKEKKDDNNLLKYAIFGGLGIGAVFGIGYLLKNTQYPLDFIGKVKR